MSGSEIRDHFTLKIDFELVVLSHSTVDGSVALCCASIAAPVPRYACSKFENTLGAILRKQPITLPLLLYGQTFWRIGGFASNPSIFLPPKFVQLYSFSA